MKVARRYSNDPRTIRRHDASFAIDFASHDGLRARISRSFAEKPRTDASRDDLFACALQANDEYVRAKEAR